MAVANDIADLAASLLSSAKPFDRLPEATRFRLAGHATDRLATPGEIIVREGDIGDDFYLVAAGALHVLGRAFDGSELVLDRIGSGACFGEQALLAEHPVPRSASVRAVTRSRLLVLPRKALKEAGEADAALIAALRKTGEGQKAELNTRFRERILSTLGIAGDYSIEHYSEGDFVFREGDPGEKIYLVTAGRALVLRGSGEEERVISELLPGQFFGELAILNNAPRVASVKAGDALEVVALDGLWFRLLLERNPRLGSLMVSLKAVYVLPTRGLLTLQSSGIASNPTLTALHHLAGGRKILSIRHTGTDAFRGLVMGADEATSSVRFANREAGIQRQLHLFESRIVEIETEGAWPGLGIAFEYMLDGTPITDREMTAFEVSGDLGKADPPPRDSAEILCRCSAVTTAAMVSAIGQGCRSLDQIAAATRATVVCGGCIPTVKELLGQDEWMAATCEDASPLAADISVFRLRTMVQARPALPGQHVILQARIRGRWVSRPYTLVSDPTQEGAYELIVRREQEGLLSRWLFDQLGDGGALRISPPQGTFCIDAGNSQAVVFLAGGIGITPALAAARSLKTRPGAWPLTIDHSVATPDQGICRRELEQLAQQEPRLTFRLRVTRDDGRIDRQDVDDYCARFPDALFWICGSDRYVTGITALLEQCALPAARIAVERFTPWG
jgi:ferredoxin-NADP reductase/CRP-like cAMP-binding protein